MVSDVIVLYVLKKRSFYREKKYLYVVDSNRDEDQYEVITEPEEADERVRMGETLLINYGNIHCNLVIIHICVCRGISTTLRLVTLLTTSDEHNHSNV